MTTAFGPTDRTRRRARLGLYAVTISLSAVVAGGPLLGSVARAIDPASAAVSGVVFDDRNGNGSRDAGEPGVAGVSVSDGVEVHRTDAEGRYAFDLLTERRIDDLVFVTQPAGWSVGTDEFKTPRFYRNLGKLADGATTTADFALTKDDASAAETSSFSFANIADPHVNAQLGEQIEEINSTKQKLGFIAVSGDLTNNATDAEFDYYKKATARSKLPVWPAVGNHEYFGGGGSGYAARINNYRRHVGPEWYSFDYADRHYLVIENNGQAPFEEQLAWAEADLAANATGKRLVVLTHQPMNVPFGAPSTYDAYGKLLEKYGAELVLVGHEHSNDVEPDSKFASTAKHIQTVSSSYTIDNAPRGFRYVHMAGEQFDNPLRMYGRQQQLTVVNPAPGSVLPMRDFDLVVNAYDTSDEATGVRVRLDGGQWFELASSGGEFSWTIPAKLNERNKKGTKPSRGNELIIGHGAHTLEVEARDAAGEKWTTTSKFTVDKRREAVVPTAGADWAQHHGDASHSGVAAQPIAAGQRLAWTYRTKGVFLTGTPTIVDGVVYAGTRDENGEGEWAVHAVELATGRQLWRHQVESSVHGSIAVSDGKVFVPNLRGVMYALDASNGAELWRYTPEAAAEPNNQRNYGYYGVTVADGKVLYPHQTRFGEASQGLVVALDPATGKAIWKAPLTGNTMSDGTPAVSDGKVFVGSQTADRVVALDLATGKQLWVGKEALGGWQDGIPSAAGGRVFIGSGNGIIARDAKTGEELWRYKSPHKSLISSNATASAAAIDGDVVYMGFPSGAVTALDARTGKVLWDRVLTGSTYEGGILSSPAVAGQTVFVGSNNGSMYALDKRTGQPLWQHQIGAWVAAGPAVSGNTVVAGAYDGNLYAWTPDGQAQRAWAQATGVVTDKATGKPVAGVAVSLLDADGKNVGTTTTDAKGGWLIAAPSGDYTVQVAKRGTIAGEPSKVTLGTSGSAQVALQVSVVTAPVAGTTTNALDYGGGSPRPDVEAGQAYAYVMNDRVQAAIVNHTAANDGKGTFQPGWLADLVLTDDKAIETLDWSEMVLTDKAANAKPWNRAGEWLSLPKVEAAGAVVTASGQAQINPGLKTRVAYQTLPGAPVVKMQMTVDNTTDADFSGVFQYIIDPDSSSDVAILPGFAGTNVGYKTSGWTSNYVYSGAASPTGQPAHALAWADDQPVGVNAAGYITSVSFDSSVKAGASRTITWYQITDYPSVGSPSASIADWAARIPALDPEAADRVGVTGAVKDADGKPVAGQLVEAVDASGAVKGSATTLADGSYRINLAAGDWTLRARGLGYAEATQKVTLANADATADLVLRTLPVDAASGATLESGIVEGASSDIVLVNDLVAMSVATGGEDPQLKGSTIGKVRDWAVRGEADQIDWLNLPYVSRTEPMGTEAWQQLQVVSKSVEVVEKSAERAVVRVSGASSEEPAITVSTDYIVEPGKPWVQAATTFTNTSSAAVDVWVGDAMDHDGAGQKSLVAGAGVITTPYGEPASHQPTGRWIAQTGNDPQVTGLVYAGQDAFSAYGNGNWIMSKFQRTIDAGASYTLDRRLVAASVDSDAIATMEQIAAK